MIFDNNIVNNMMQHKAYHIFTHKDLDGAVSLLTFLWSRPDASISYNEITNLEIDKIKNYVNRLINPKNIILMDLPLREEFLPDLDKEFITIIDHHERSIDFIDKFKHSKIIHKTFTSNSLLIRKIFQDNFPNLTLEQKKLILYADDYDCFNLNYKESYDLNIIFWNQFRNNFSSFIDFYKNGFVPFNDKQLKILDYVKRKTEVDASNLTCYEGIINIESNPIKTIAVSDNKSDILVLDFLMKKHNPDLFIYINTKTEKITYRKKRDDNNFNLQKFTEKYSEGTGNSYSGVGKITPLFLELTKNFKPL
jgi:hypothetical protein